MKKDDIKSALGKIEPSEELIQATLLKMQEQKQKEKKKPVIEKASKKTAKPIKNTKQKQNIKKQAKQADTKKASPKPRM